MNLVLLAVAAAAFPFPVQERTLSNGLHMYVVKFDSPGTIAYYSVVRTGSRNEVEAGKSGFAHFFEHMMFRGTEKVPADKYTAFMKRIGADENAYTSSDMTIYHVLAGKQALPELIEIEADRFQNLKYAEPDFQKESRAVLGEYNKSASNPLLKMHELLYDNAYTTHTYKHTTIGFIKDIENMPNEFAYSRRFFDLYYRPDNVTLLVCGDVDADEFFKLAEKAYGGWKKGPPKPQVPQEPPQQKEKRATLDWKGPTLPMFLEGWHTPAFSTTNTDFAALEVLAELLFSERAPLYKKLVITEQKVESIGGGSDPYRDPNLFSVLARLKDRKDLDYVEKAVDAEIARIAKQGVDKKTLDDTLAHIKYAFQAELSTADRTADTGARFIALTGNLNSINDYYQMMGRVTSADISRVAKQYFSARNKTIVLLPGGAK